MTDSAEDVLEDEGPEPPPPGVRGMARFRWFLIVAAAILAGASWWSFARADEHAETEARYYCPMHPEITSHDPGECPICHMTLELIPASRRPGAASASASPGARPKPAPSRAEPPSSSSAYTCPMHPQVRADKPGRCPICGMDLVPVQTSRGGAAQPAPKDSLPEGTSEVKLTLDRAQSIGVRTALAETENEGGALRAPAVVEAPESGVAVVHVRAPGFVERVMVRETGVKVAAGQELAAFYSPEIYQAELELLTVRGWGAAAQGTSTEDSIVTKLKLFGVSDRMLERVTRTAKPERTLSLVSPIAGFISTKNVDLG